MKTLIQGGYVVAFDGKSHRIIQDGVVVFENDTVIYTGKTYPGEVDRTIEARGNRIISPGFIDAEAVTSIDVQGFALDIGRKDFFGPSGWNMAPTESFLLRNEKNPPVETWEDSYAAAEFGTAQCLKSGSTTLVATWSAVKDFMQDDPTIQAIGRLGARAYVGRPYSAASWYLADDGTCRRNWDEEKGLADLDKGRKFAARHEGSFGDRIKGMLFASGVVSSTPKLLKRTKAVAKELNVPIRIHCAENFLEFYEIIERYTKTPVEFLADLDFLGPDVLLHHAIFTDGHSWVTYPEGQDVKILADSGAAVSHAPLIFARRSVALESLHRYLKAGVNMALATDTFPPDMIMTMRLASLFCKVMERNVNTGTARDVYNVATLGGAKALGREDLGRLAPGAKADIAIINLESPRVGPIDDPIRTLVHYTTMDDVETVIVDGKTVVLGGEVQGMSNDETELLARVQRMSEKAKVAIAARTGQTPDERFPPSFPIE